MGARAVFQDLLISTWHQRLVRVPSPFNEQSGRVPADNRITRTSLNQAGANNGNGDRPRNGGRRQHHRL